MLKKLLMVALLYTIAIAANAGDGQKITSKVQKVIVFLNGAQVTRTAMVNVNAGTSELIFGEISPGVDVQSIQVHADGEFTILSVKHELDFLNEQAKQKQVEDLKAIQKSIKDKISLQNNLSSIYQQEESMLAKNQVVTGENASLDVLKLKQALDFQTERLTGIKEKEQAVTNTIAALYLELQKYDMQIAEITKGSSTATSNIIVIISSKAALQSLFTLSYVVHNASWYPTYDIRAKDINSPVSISYKANVSQQSGEDWKNIKLTLSTGNPSVSGSKPALSPYYLNFGMYYSSQDKNITNVRGSVFDEKEGTVLPGASVKIKGTSIGTSVNADGSYDIQIASQNQILVFSYIGYETVERVASESVINVGMKQSRNSLNEVVVVGYGTSNSEADVALEGKVAGVNVNRPSINTIPIAIREAEHQTNIEFNIDNPWSIPSDGKQYAVEINQVDLKAGFQYYVAPKISTDVFLTAQITDWNKYNFLSGEANLFFEGTYIGKSLIDTHAVADTLNLSLGTDKNIVVTRTLQKDLTEKQALVFIELLRIDF